VEYINPEILGTIEGDIVFEPEFAKNGRIVSVDTREHRPTEMKAKQTSDNPDSQRLDFDHRRRG